MNKIKNLVIGLLLVINISCDDFCLCEGIVHDIVKNPYYLLKIYNDSLNEGKYLHETFSMVPPEWVYKKIRKFQKNYIFENRGIDYLKNKKLSYIIIYDRGKKEQMDFWFYIEDGKCYLRQISFFPYTKR